MSNVRLSSGSPTLERTEARPPDHPRPSACRNLFGPVDREALKKDFQRHMKQMEDASADAWSFDFSAHTPRAGGRYRWEALDVRTVPAFYSRSERRTGSGANGCASGNNHDCNVDVNGNRECRVTEETPGDQRRPAGPDSCQSKRSHICVDEVTRTPRKLKRPRKAPSPAPT